MAVGAVDETPVAPEVEADPGEDTGAPDLESLMSDAEAPVPTDAVDFAAADAGEPAPEVSPAAEPASSAGFPTVPQFEPIGPPPPPPALSADPAENTRRMVQWQRDLVAHHNEVTNRQVALNEFAAKVATAKGAKEAAVAAAKAEAIKQENAQAAERRARAQAAIDAAVQERISAKRDLESFKWEHPHDGRTIAALILGGMAQGVGDGPRNEAAVAIETKMKRDFEAKKAKYAAAGDSLLMAKYGVSSAEDAHRAAMNDLNADFAARYKLIADQAESVLKQQGVPAEQAKGNALVTSANQEAAKQEAEIHNREEGHRIQRESNAATLALARANLGERRREFDEGRANREADRKDKAADKKAAADQNLEVRGGDGNVVGLATSSRVVKPTQDRLIQYDDAIKSAEDLLAYRKAHNIVGRLPTGEAYDRAVLAVAATTQANASDATTAHEAGTLKSLGMVDEKAIEKTIEHLKTRQAAFLRQLRPVATEGVPAAAPARAAARGGDDAETKAKIDRAWKTIDDPKQPKAERQGARRFLQDQGQL